MPIAMINLKTFSFVLALFVSSSSFAIPENVASAAYSYQQLGVSLAGSLATGALLGEEDKRRHFWAGGAISGATAWSLSKAGVPKIWCSVTGLAIGVLAGYVKERRDQTIGKPFDQRDWDATSAGAAWSLVLINIPW